MQIEICVLLIINQSYFIKFYMKIAYLKLFYIKYIIYIINWILIQYGNTIIGDWRSNTWLHIFWREKGKLAYWTRTVSSWISVSIEVFYHINKTIFQLFLLNLVLWYYWKSCLSYSFQVLKQPRTATFFYR